LSFARCRALLAILHGMKAAARRRADPGPLNPLRCPLARLPSLPRQLRPPLPRTPAVRQPADFARGLPKVPFLLFVFAKCFQIGDILGATGGLLVSDQRLAAEDVEFHSFEFRLHLAGPGFVEGNTSH